MNKVNKQLGVKDLTYRAILDDLQEGEVIPLSNLTNIRLIDESKVGLKEGREWIEAILSKGVLPYMIVESKDVNDVLDSELPLISTGSVKNRAFLAGEPHGQFAEDLEGKYLLVLADADTWSEGGFRTGVRGGKFRGDIKVLKDVDLSKTFIFEPFKDARGRILLELRKKPSDQEIPIDVTADTIRYDGRVGLAEVLEISTSDLGAVENPHETKTRVSLRPVIPTTEILREEIAARIERPESGPVPGIDPDLKIFKSERGIERKGMERFFPLLIPLMNAEIISESDLFKALEAFRSKLNYVTNRNLNLESRGDFKGSVNTFDLDFGLEVEEGMIKVLDLKVSKKRSFRKDITYTLSLYALELPKVGKKEPVQFMIVPSGDNSLEQRKHAEKFIQKKLL